jgi:hypothetical protein
MPSALIRVYSCAVTVLRDDPNLADDLVVESRKILGRDPVLDALAAADDASLVTGEKGLRDVELRDKAKVAVPGVSRVPVASNPLGVREGQDWIEDRRLRQAGRAESEPGLPARETAGSEVGAHLPHAGRGHLGAVERPRAAVNVIETAVEGVELKRGELERIGVVAAPQENPLRGWRSGYASKLAT